MNAETPPAKIGDIFLFVHISLFYLFVFFFNLHFTSLHVENMLKRIRDVKRNSEKTLSIPPLSYLSFLFILFQSLFISILVLVDVASGPCLFQSLF